MMKQTSFRSTRNRGRRRGQALLLAVLVMIFAALLGAAFIAVVSLNLNQTARQVDKTSAAQSARAGVEYVNKQLTYSGKGPEDWFRNLNQPDDPLDPSYNIYYTPFEKAQGWAGQYAKFPDPRSELTDPTSANRFLVRVDRVPYNIAYTDPEGDKVGQLRISVIGLSSEDPAVYSKVVRYKGGMDQAPLGQTLRTVANWDFANNAVPAGQIDSIAGNVLTLRNVEGKFPEAPFYITIGTKTNVRAALVEDIDTNQLTVTTAITPAPTTGERVELSAALGFANTIDYDRSGAADVTIPENNLTATTEAAGVRVNGGLYWYGRSLLNQLTSSLSAYGAGTVTPGTIRSSGVVALQTAGETRFTSEFDATEKALVSSANPDFPATPLISNDRLVIDDGYNRILGNAGTSNRLVRHFAPPNFAFGEGLERYRKMTRYSKQIPAADVEPNLGGTVPANAALYGYGEGIYIDNFQDREQRFDGTQRRDMNRLEYLNFLYDQTSTSSATYYLRSATPANSNNTGDANRSKYSLEDTHTRGWVAKDEFRPRGALIELAVNGVGEPVIYITRDGREDNTDASPANSVDAVDNKAWRDENGDIIEGLYRREYKWPKGGVIFAEGNIRIRGDITPTAAPTHFNSLTVVSMNNIYIEGPLALRPFDDDSNKLLLLAKNNVVVNPTAMVSRPDDKSVVLPASASVITTAGTNATLTVQSTKGFEVGDVIEIVDDLGTPVVEQRGGILRITGTPTLTTIPVQVIQGDGGTYGPGAIIRHAKDTLPATNVSIVDTLTAATTTAAAVQRRLVLPNTVTNALALDIVHSADRKPALRVIGEDLPLREGTVYIGNKLTFTTPPPFAYASVPAPQTALTTNPYKRLTGRFDAPPTGPTGIDTFPTLTTDDKANADLVTITALAGNSGVPTSLNGYPAHPVNPPTTGWKYSATVLGYGAAPFYYLAGVGNRHEWDYSGTGSNDWRKDVMTTQYDIPLATSILMAVQGTNSLLTDLRGNQTNQFGFDPSYVGTAAIQEDVLTTDQTFYSLATDNAFTLDTRRAGGLTVGPTAQTVRLEPSTGLIGIDATNPLPAYRLSYLKPEDIAVTGTTDVDVSPLSWDINAFVYAQQGSWLVLPAPIPDLDPKLKFTLTASGTDFATASYYDKDNDNTPDTGEFLDVDGTPGYSAQINGGDHADLNRNGVSDPEEIFWFQRFKRLNVSLRINGAIMENLSAPIQGNANVPSAVESWMERSVGTTIDTGSAATMKWQVSRMTVTLDRSVALGLMNDRNGFYLPQSEGLVYEG